MFWNLVFEAPLCPCLLIGLHIQSWMVCSCELYLMLLHPQPMCIFFVWAVMEGMDLVMKIESLGSGSGKPSKKVTISDSGVLPM